MIIHRDYRSTSDSVVKVFDDYIEFYNPGKLPEEITIEDLLSGNYKSTPRNRKIADFFKNMGWIEKYGSGIGRIRDFFKEAGLPEPEFKPISEGFQVTVFDGKTTQDTGGAIGGANNNNNNLTERQLEIIRIINETPAITYRALAKQLDINDSAVLKHLDNLKKRGIIERIGKTRGYWKVTQN
ncbi:hypothetical protein FACS1894182_14070 [Bacteroidia bacterium]|nr:hypothetical protein FACS1894182_14070 [Bacteroidia bacterium]